VYLCDALGAGLSEMTRIGTAYGASPLTFLGLAGVGDLFLTVIHLFAPAVRIPLMLREINSAVRLLAEITQLGFV
jgi:glycerol-3-phosphate dehydrogenase